MTQKSPLFFFHIPKTAGSTMQSILSSHYEAAQTAAAFTWTTLLGIDKDALSKKVLFQGHFYGPLENVAAVQCNTFTILRDPIERALSHYGHVCRDENHYLHGHAVALGTLEAYLDDPIARMTVSNFQSRMLALDFDIETYYNELSELERAQWCLERHIETTDFGLTEAQIHSSAKKKLDQFFLIGITEQFPQTLALLCNKMEWKYPQREAKENTNPERLRQSDIHPNTLQKLQQLNAVDLAIYSAAKTSFQEHWNLFSSQASRNSPFTKLLKRLLG